MSLQNLHCPLPQRDQGGSTPEPTYSVRASIRPPNLLWCSTRFLDNSSTGQKRDQVRKWAYPETAQIFWVPPIISGTGKATGFKFGGYIYRVNLNKSPLKIFQKGACTYPGTVQFFGYGDSRVVSISDFKARGPGFDSRWGQRSLVMELVNIYHSLSCSFVEINRLYVVSVCIN